MKRPIYLDYAATTPVDPRVVAKMLPCLNTEFGNPSSSSHEYGRAAKQLVDRAREQVASLINASPQEIIWTSGATEADNLAIIGAAQYYQARGRHIITCKTEHKAVLDTCRFLAGQGYQVTYLTPQPNGLISLEELQAAITPETILVSIMQVNNETGVIQDIKVIGEICRENNIVFHVDAAQSTGKAVINLQDLPVDLMSFSAHKCYGPKGIGALYVRSKPHPIKLRPLLHGGGQEHGLRPGTLAVHQIVGMGEAWQIAQAEMATETLQIRQLRDKLWQGVSAIPGIVLNGDLQQRVPHHLNISFSGIDGSALPTALKDLAISSGSACASGIASPSYVLRAMGLSHALAQSALRITLGRFTTEADIDFAIQHIQNGVEWLRSL